MKRQTSQRPGGSGVEGCRCVGPEIDGRNRFGNDGEKQCAACNDGKRPRGLAPQTGREIFGEAASLVACTEKASRERGVGFAAMPPPVTPEQEEAVVRALTDRDWSGVSQR